jgi:hypothetical protein
MYIVYVYENRTMKLVGIDLRVEEMGDEEE